MIQLHPEWPPAIVDAWFYKVLGNFKISSPLPPTRFIELDEEKRRRVASGLGMPLLSELTCDEKPQDGMTWKKRSLCIYRANKCEWPVDFERHDTPSLIEVFPLRPREMDTAWILDTMFPPPSNPCILEPEVADANPELSRNLESYLDENDELRTDLNGRSPWRTKVPTLVGSGRFMVRHVDPTIPAHATCKRFVVRLLEPFECFRLVGWQDFWWVPYQGKRARAFSASDLGLYFNLAGNAFSCFHYLPWMASMLATWGRYLNAPPPSLHASAVAQPPVDQDRRLSTVAVCDSLSEPDSD